VELTKVAECDAPLYVTVDALRKSPPLIVNVCALAPTVVEDGDRLAILGTGFDDGGGFDCGAEVPPQPVKNSRTAANKSTLRSAPSMTFDSVAHAGSGFMLHLIEIQVLTRAADLNAPLVLASSIISSVLFHSPTSKTTPVLKVLTAFL
jgi:hypothetical protein